MKKIVKYVIVDILRNKIVVAYTLFLLVISLSVFNLEDNSAKGLLSLLNLILFIVPLVCIIFSTIYAYNSSEFIELLVSQPLKRRTIWMSLFWGLSISLGLAFFVGVGIPVLLYQMNSMGFIMLAMGCGLSVIFVSIALLASLLTRDKAKGIGLSILLWIYFALIFDGLLLFLLFQFADYPMEKISAVLTAFNPIDLSRILILLKMDVSALMGYTGAVYKEIFGTTTGLLISSLVLVLWMIVPVTISKRKFNKKDL